MSILAVTRREWIGRRNVLLLSLGMGLLQFLGLHLNPDPAQAFDKTSFLAVATGTMYAWAVAALYGATMLSRDLEERRFGFLLNQPLHEAQIFLGKVLAGVGLAFLSGLLACLPPLLLSGFWRQLGMREAGSILGVWLAGSLVLLLLFHALSIQVRSRSLWLALDLAAWSFFFLGVRLLSLRLMAVDGFREMAHLWLGLLIAVSLGLAVAGYLQVSEGRADLQRGHRWVSLTMVSTLVLVLLGGWAQVVWTLKHRPAPVQTQARTHRIR